MKQNYAIDEKVYGRRFILRTLIINLSLLSSCKTKRKSMEMFTNAADINAHINYSNCQWGFLLSLEIYFKRNTLNLVPVLPKTHFSV